MNLIHLDLLAEARQWASDAEDSGQEAAPEMVLRLVRAIESLQEEVDWSAEVIELAGLNEVHLVTSGSGADGDEWNVEGIFAREEAAKAYIDSHGWTDTYPSRGMPSRRVSLDWRIEAREVAL